MTQEPGRLPSQSDSAGEETKAHVRSPFSLLGWVLGAFSVLYLVDDLNVVQLRGLVGKWVDAYATFVARMRDFFFGWIDVAWLSISDNEAHVIAIGGLFAAALGRAHMRHVRRALRTPWIEAFFETTLVALIIVLLLVVLPALLIPFSGGFWLAIVGLLFLYLGCFSRRSRDSRLPPPRLVAAELGGTLGIFALLIASNYALSAQG